MDWRKLIAELGARGWTQQLICERVGCAQATLSDLSRGITSAPRYELGRALEILHASGDKPETVKA